MYLTTPQLSLVYEQYAIIMFNPTINIHSKVTPKFYPSWQNNKSAILEIENILSSFPDGSFGHQRFTVFLQVLGIKYNLMR